MLQTAIILAGGYGTRLQSVVSDVPKPMAPINNEPFLNYQLRYLKHFGIKNCILSVGYLSEKIIHYYGASFEGISITYVTEDSPLGTGGGIRLAMEQTTDETVLTLNGDSFFDVNLEEFFTLHTVSEAGVSLALRQVENAARYGTIALGEHQRIVSFHEKNNIAEAGLINGGVYLLNRKLYLDNTPVAKNFSIENHFFETQLTQLTINGFEFPGYFIDIGIPEDYTKAQNDFKGFKYK